MIALRNAERLPPEVRWELELLMAVLQALAVTDLQGFTAGATSRFLREDGTFAEAGVTHAQALVRASLRG